MRSHSKVTMHARRAGHPVFTVTLHRGVRSSRAADLAHREASAHAAHEARHGDHASVTVFPTGAVVRCGSFKAVFRASKEVTS